MSFIRKKSLDKTKLPSSRDSNRITTASTEAISFSQQIDHIKHITFQSNHNQPSAVADAIRILVQTKIGLSVSVKLTAYKQAINLVTRYLLHLKIKGMQVDNTNIWNMLSTIISEIVALSKDENNDDVIHNADLIGSIFSLLDSCVTIIEIDSQKKQKKPTLMRKNSLKKVEELPTIRPSSRGKLSSLSKKDIPSKHQLFNLTLKTEEPQQPSSIQDTVYQLLCILKNLSANKKTKSSLFKDEYLRLMNRYFVIWNDKNYSSYANTIMVQITSAYRHLAADEKAYKYFLSANCLDGWCRAIEMFPTNNDLMFNILRILSKVSSYGECCQKLDEKKACLQTLGTFFKIYRTSIHIIIRVAFIFANLTSYLADIRSQLYFKFGTWNDIVGCFMHYADSELKGKNEVEKMGISMAAWDYQAMKKQSDIDTIIKLIRLIANLFTVANIGQDIYVNDSKTYKDLVFKLKSLLERKSISHHADLITCTLSCLTNILYYDKQLLLSSLQYKQAKVHLISLLVNFVVQIDNQQICCESLRVISNITRMKDYVKAVIDAKIHQAIIILLDSTSKQIVYYSLGTIINLLSDQSFKLQYKSQITTGVIEILKACQSEDLELVTVGLKVLSSITTDNLDPNIINQIEGCLISLGTHCDRIIIGDNKKGEVNSAQQARAFINVLLNNMPQQKYICPIKNCGRKFADQKKLIQHVTRRHKAS